MKKKYVYKWKAVLHFGRGHVEEYIYENKQDALENIKIAVFNNEDCTNFSCYKFKEELL